MSTPSHLCDVPAIRDYLNRIGAEPRSLREAIVRENSGNYWRDIATIKFEKDGTVKVHDKNYEPTSNEAQAISVALQSFQWPSVVPITTLDGLPMAAEKKNIFEFRDEGGAIVMVQIRIDKNGADGSKSYLPWTYWSDGQWRMLEPEGQLPLYNIHRIKEATTVFIHEGAKAARKCQWLADGETAEAREACKAHPWGEQLRNAIHLGWIGGALSPMRTDWVKLRRAGVKRAYIVSDNDLPGLSAVPKISKQLNCLTFAIRFTDEFPPGFDLADNFPDEMFQTEKRYYTGPTFKQCLDPATWATDMVQNPSGKGRSLAVLRDSFKEMWAYAEAADLYVCKEMPTRRRSTNLINKTLAPFTDIYNVAQLIEKAYEGRSVGVCYRPDHLGLMVTHGDSQSINLHVPPDTPSAQGDVGPWEEFLEYMFVNEEERRNVKRWVATLIARPDLRVCYGLLLISENQGIGKTTLGTKILAPLVGNWNVGYPSEQDILSQFNHWLAHKRLVIVSEIYSGASWKAYHALKSTITDHEIMVNEKYQQPYTIENWASVIACSNSMRALKLENDDRRWFCPEITESAWPAEKFGEFRNWLDCGGVQIIKGWAEKFGDYVHPSERAPMTERKREMIEGSRSEAQREAAAIAEAMQDLNEPVAIPLRSVVEWCRANVQGKVWDTDYEIRKAMTDKGLTLYEERLKISSRREYILINKELKQQILKIDRELGGMGKQEKHKIVRDFIKRTDEIMESSI